MVRVLKMHNLTSYQNFINKIINKFKMSNPRDLNVLDLDAAFATVIANTSDQNVAELCTEVRTRLAI